MVTETDEWVQRLARDAKILAVMETFPDSHNVKTTLAAIFLGLDRKTLLRKRRGYTRKRQKDTGLGGVQGDRVSVPPLRGFPQPVNAPPRAAQNFDGAQGENADLFWNMADLRAWKLKRHGGADAFTKHQLTGFAAALADLSEPMVWISGDDGLLMGDLYGSSDEIFDAWLKASPNLDALTASSTHQALLELPWQSAELRADWHGRFGELLTQLAHEGERRSQARQRELELQERSN
jgi:hypothetical protein